MVAAAASAEKAPTPNLEALALLRARASGDELVKLGVEANVHQSAKDVLE